MDTQSHTRTKTHTHTPHEEQGKQLRHLSRNPKQLPLSAKDFYNVTKKQLEKHLKNVQSVCKQRLAT